MELASENVVTPRLAPGQSVTYQLEIATLNGGDAQQVLPVRFSGAAAFDECQIALQFQGVKGALYSLDGGTTWESVGDGVISVPRGSTLGVLALKLYPDLPWPNEPFLPLWDHRDEQYLGDKVFLYYPDSMPLDDSGEVVEVKCGNSFELRVQVKPSEETLDGATP